MRCSIGGCVEKSAMKPGLSLMPNALIDSGSARRLDAAERLQRATIGFGEPSRLADAASARNSRRRENHVTIIDARMPNTISHTMTVMK